MPSRAQLSLSAPLLLGLSLGALPLGCGNGGPPGPIDGDAVGDTPSDAPPLAADDGAGDVDDFDGRRGIGSDAGADAISDAVVGDAGGDSASPWIGATVGTAFTTFELAITGEGTDRLSALAFSDDVGSFRLAGAPFRGVAYRVSESFGGYNLFAVLSVAEDGGDLAIVYLYCMGAELQYAYAESFTLPPALEPAVGRCNYTLPPLFFADVTLPSLFRSVDAIDTGTSIDGPGLTLAATGGTMDLLGETWELQPFSTVDCGACPGGPWYELHAMLHRPGAGCFAILYLFPDRPDQVLVSNVLCLPSLAQPMASFSATWTRSALHR